VWQRIPWARYNPRLLDWSYWLLFAGVIVMVTDLTLAGLAEARVWQTSAPWIESVRAARPYWWIRTLSAVPIAAGFITLLIGLTTGGRGAGLGAIRASIGLDPVKEIAPVFAKPS
jgi:cytochrome c oxidase cbb3-type subunit 1